MNWPNFLLNVAAVESGNQHQSWTRNGPLLKGWTGEYGQESASSPSGAVAPKRRTSSTLPRTESGAVSRPSSGTVARRSNIPGNRDR